MKDKEISEEELLDELDTMYQRVADIEREEASQQTEQTSPPPKMKPRAQKKKRPYRTIIVMASVFLIVIASVMAITIFEPMTLLERLKTGGTQPSTVVTPPAPKKRSPVAPSPATPKPPAVVTSQEPSKPSTATTSSAPSPPVALSPTVSPKLPSESLPAPTKQGPAKNRPPLSGKYYAIQVGAFRDMENVRELVEVFKKEGLEARWITMKSKGSLYKVLVGQFKDENEAAAFLKENKIFDKYPGSFVKEISPSKINRQ